MLPPDFPNHRMVLHANKKDPRRMLLKVWSMLQQQLTNSLQDICDEMTIQVIVFENFIAILHCSDIQVHAGSTCLIEWGVNQLHYC